LIEQTRNYRECDQIDRPEAGLLDVVMRYNSSQTLLDAAPPSLLDCKSAQTSRYVSRYITKSRYHSTEARLKSPLATNLIQFLLPSSLLPVRVRIHQDMQNARTCREYCRPDLFVPKRLFVKVSIPTKREVAVEQDQDSSFTIFKKRLILWIYYPTLPFDLRSASNLAKIEPFNQI